MNNKYSKWRPINGNSVLRITFIARFSDILLERLVVDGEIRI